MTTFKRTVFGMLAMLAAVAVAAPAVASTGVGTGFTYQGRLKDAGQSATGQFDFQFLLFDADVNGAQVGGTLLKDNVDVTGGLFTTALDFGNQFDGKALWLEIRVRPGNSAGAYTTLTPRQPLTATPYAVYALGDALWHASGSAITNSNTGFVGVNRTSKVTGNEYFGIQAPVSGNSYGGMYIRTDSATGIPFYGYANSGGSSAWTYYDGQTDKWGIHAGGLDRLIIDADGNVGINESAPSARLDVTTDGTIGISGTATGSFSKGVYGYGLSAGVRGDCASSNGAGVYGDSGSTGTGVEGHNDGNGGGSGVAGYATAGTGVYGSTWTGYAMYGSNGGSNSSGYAGYFNGRVHVAGTLSKSSGSFKIDHPLDPANKYLSHSFVESPDMMNIYNGNAVLDDNGAAVIEMPEWFQALNQEFRYQLTTIGGFAPVYVATEMENNKFSIAGGKPGMKVSWQVTGIRHDAYANAHRIPVEENKPENEKGKYLTPEVFGAAPEMGIGHLPQQDAKARAMDDEAK